MAAGIRKCLDLAPAIENPWQNLATPATIFKVNATRTRWVRTWVSWARAMPTSSTYDSAYLALIDNQINAARANAINTILVTWEFPTWSNGTQGVNEATYRLEDRDLGGGRRKSLTQGVPEGQLGVDGYWGKWIQFLMNRYGAAGGGVVLEIMNEPNLQWWPQINSAGSHTAACRVAEMMHTAWVINGYYNGYIAAPAMSDIRSAENYRLRTPYDAFMANLKSALDFIGFHGDSQHFLWSHHNYSDIETLNYAGYNGVWSALHNWWKGWSATGIPNGADPGIWITEGGCRIEKLSSTGLQALADQATHVEAAYQIMSMATGAAMFTNYQLHTTAQNNQTGLLAPYPDNTQLPVWQKFYNMAPNL